MPQRAVQLGPNQYYGDQGPENPAEGAEWILASGQRQVFVGGKWRSPPVGYPAGNGAGGAVTQITDATTAVTLDRLTGQITTVALTTAGAAEEIFQVNNAFVAAGDVVALSTTYAGQGTPMLGVIAVAAGSFKIVITNLSASALNAVCVINFAVIKGATT